MLCISKGQLGTTPEQYSEKGCAEAMKACPGITEAGRQASSAWMQDEGLASAQDMLQRNPTINIFFGRADALALGAAQAAKVGGISDAISVGCDGDRAGLEAVKAGTLKATMTQQTQGMGRLALKSALELIKGEKPSRDLGDDSTPSRGSAVPSAGAKKDEPKGDASEGGMEPQPH